MGKSVAVSIFRVFVNKNNKFGNPVGIILDENRQISTTHRQEIATNLNFSESVFINDSETGAVSLFNPKSEVDFSGYALIGTAHFINSILDKHPDSLHCNAGRVRTWQEKDLTWIRANLKNTPPWRHEQLPNASAIDKIPASQAKSKKHTMVWAWLNQNKGIIRARTFAPDWGIPEDEANGSGSMQLAISLGRDLEIHQGKGSIIYAKPVGKDFADVGGRVKAGPIKEITFSKTMSSWKG